MTICPLGTVAFAGQLGGGVTEPAPTPGPGIAVMFGRGAIRAEKSPPAGTGETTGRSGAGRGLAVGAEGGVGRTLTMGFAGTASGKVATGTRLAADETPTSEAVAVGIASIGGGRAAWAEPGTTVAGGGVTDIAVGGFSSPPGGVFRSVSTTRPGAGDAGDGPEGVPPAAGADVAGAEEVGAALGGASAASLAGAERRAVGGGAGSGGGTKTLSGFPGGSVPWGAGPLLTAGGRENE